MAVFPISPRHARMLLEVVSWQLNGPGGLGSAAEDSLGPGSMSAAKKKPKKSRDGEPRSSQEVALPYAVALAAALSVESPFIHVELRAVSVQYCCVMSFC